MLDVPMYFVYRDGKYIDVAGHSFRDYFNVCFLLSAPLRVECASSLSRRQCRLFTCCRASPQSCRASARLSWISRTT